MKYTFLFQTICSVNYFLKTFTKIVQTFITLLYTNNISTNDKVKGEATTRYSRFTNLTNRNTHITDTHHNKADRHYNYVQGGMTIRYIT